MTYDDTVEIITNEYRECLNMVTDRVSIRTVKKPEGSLALIEVDVKAPTYYISSEFDTNPKFTNGITFYIDIKDGYPREKPYVYYKPGKMLASINVFKNGAQCIDAWIYDEEHAGRNSTLAGTIRKTIMDIIHDPTVSRYDSMANCTLESWQKGKTASGEFPTCRLSSLLITERERTRKRECPALPTRPVGVIKKEPPSLPSR